MRILAAICALSLAGPAAGTEGGQEAFAALEVNGVAHGDVLVLLRQGDVLCPVKELERAGLHDFGGRREGERVSLASLAPAVTFSFDEETVTLKLRAAADRLPESHIDFSESPRPQGLEYRDTPSAFLNYAVQTDGSRTAAFGEVGASASGALLYSGFSAQASGAPTRGMSSLTYDQPSALRRIVAGDFVALPGSALGSGALLGGISIARELSLDPYFISAPHQELSGAVTTPSKMDIYVDGRLVRTEDVAPGIFRIENVPGYGTAGDTRVVVRDAFGRTQELSAATRAPANLLAPGFSDYALQLGFRRNSFGTAAFDYGSPAIVARERVGVTSWLTSGVRGEADAHVCNAGPVLSMSLPFASLELSGAASRAAGQPGAAGALIVASSSRYFGLSGQLTLQSPRYADLSLVPATDRPAAQGRLTISTSLGQRASISAGVNSSWMRDGGRISQLMLRAGIPLGRSITLGLTGTGTQQNGATSLGAYVGLTIPLGQSSVATASVESGGSGTLQAQRALPVGEGVGYSLRATGGNGQSASADVQAQASFGRVEAIGTAAPGGRSWSLGASGGLVLARGQLFATRSVQDGFAVVEVPGIAGVRTYLNGQDAGSTDSNGRLLLPAVLPYQANRISIRDADVPWGYDIRGVERLVAGPARGAALARFDITPIAAFPARLRVVAPDGFSVPANGDLTVEGNIFPIGLDGSVYLEHLAPGPHQAHVGFAGGECDLELRIPGPGAPLQGLGNLDCATKDLLHRPQAIDQVAHVIHGRLFVDDNGDGSWEPGEPLIPRLLVRTGGREGITNLDGAFWIDGVRAGDVTVSLADPFELPPAVVFRNIAARMPQGGGAVEVELAARHARAVYWRGTNFEAESPMGDIRAYVMHWIDLPLAARAGKGSDSSRARRDAKAIDLLEELAAIDIRYCLVLLVPYGGRFDARARLAAVALRRRLVAALGPRKVLPVWMRGQGGRLRLLLVRERLPLALAGADR